MRPRRAFVLLFLRASQASKKCASCASVHHVVNFVSNFLMAISIWSEKKDEKHVKITNCSRTAAYMLILSELHFYSPDVSYIHRIPYILVPGPCLRALERQLVDSHSKIETAANLVDRGNSEPLFL